MPLQTHLHTHFTRSRLSSSLKSAVRTIHKRHHPRLLLNDVSGGYRQEAGLILCSTRVPRQPVIILQDGISRPFLSLASAALPYCLLPVLCVSELLPCRVCTDIKQQAVFRCSSAKLVAARSPQTPIPARPTRQKLAPHPSEATLCRRWLLRAMVREQSLATRA
jgi:hypothetical protein